MSCLMTELNFILVQFINVDSSIEEKEVKKDSETLKSLCSKFYVYFIFIEKCSSCKLFTTIIML